MAIMPVLKNQRHELFAQALAKGMTQVAAYEVAGYKLDAAPKDGPGHPSRLAEDGRIRERVAELQGAAAERAIRAMAKSKGDIVVTLDEAIELSREIKQPASIVTAAMGQAKILGHITDKHSVEITAIKDMTLEQLKAVRAKG